MNTSKKYLFFILMVGMVCASCTPIEEKVAFAVAHTREAEAGVHEYVPEQVVVEIVVTATPDLAQSGNDASDGNNPSGAEATNILCPVDVSQTEIYTLGYLDGGDVLVTFQLEGAHNAQGYLLDVAGIDYSCDLLPAYPDRIYCHGSHPPITTDIPLRLVADDELCADREIAMSLDELPSAVLSSRESSGEETTTYTYTYP